MLKIERSMVKAFMSATNVFRDSRFYLNFCTTHTIYKKRVEPETQGRLTKTRYNDIAHLFDRKKKQKQMHKININKSTTHH